MANIYDMADTWNDAGVTFTAIKMNVTNTASNGNSRLIDLQVGGTSQFYVTRGGAAGLLNQLSVGISGNKYINFWGRGNITAEADGVFSLKNDAGTASSFLAVDANHTLALRNSTNGQALRVYNTYTDASNYERVSATWSSNVAWLASEFTGTGTARPLYLVSGNVGSTRALEVGGISGSSFAGIFSIGTVAGGFGIDNETTDATGPASRKGPFVGYKNGSLARLTVSHLLVNGAAGSGHTVSGLPTGPTGAIARVTDASSPTIGNTVTGGGAAYALVNYNGSNWTVIGI